jgi:hypothetical protein
MAIDDPHPRPSAPPRAGAGDPLPADDEVLPCGRLLSRVWEKTRDTTPGTMPDGTPGAGPHPVPDPHTVSCPYCHEAAGELAAVDAATRALRSEDLSGPRTLIDRVMNTVRAEARLGRLLPPAGPDQGPRIAESAAAKILRRAADTVPGARAAGCRLVAEGEGTGVRVTMTVAAALDRPLPGRIRQVRRSVIRSAGQDLGLAVTAVDITVVDVLEP